MLGEFVTSLLVLLLGYAYPAFECFRTIEDNRTQIEQFRFWCQYWIIIGLMTAVEKFGDLFVSWLPLYGEVKLAFIIYLWHPKTRGAWYVYNKFIYPFLSMHQSGIEGKIMEIGRRSGEWLMFYVRNFTDRGQSMAFDLLQYVLRQASGRRSPAPPPQPQPSAPPLRSEGLGFGGARERPRDRRHRRQEEEEKFDGIAEIERLVQEMKAAGEGDYRRWD